MPSPALDAELQQTKTRLAEVEAALHDSEERFRAFASATSDVVYRMNPDWTEMRHLRGREFIRDTDEPSRAWLDDYIPAEDRIAVRAAVDRSIATGSVFDLEHRVIRVDGSVGWTHSRAIPVLDRQGIVAEWVGSASDITQRRLAEQALQVSELRYRTLFDSIDEGYCIIRVLFDADGHGCDYLFVEVNKAFERQTGIHDAVGRTMTSISPAHESEWYEIYGRIAMTGVSERFEFPADSLGKYYDVYAFRIGDPEDRQVAVLFHDISDRRRHEIALREADRRKDEFLAMLAHELRNPLAPIRTGLHILRLAGADCAPADQVLPMLQRQVDHMVRLVDDLLEVSRITGGKIDLRRERVDLATVLQSAIETSKPLIDAAHHRLAIELPGDPLIVDADAVRLSQVIANLLNNAAKYTDNGGRIRVAAFRQGDDALVTVEDNGTGIPRDMLTRVFDLFTQAERSYQRAQGGLGIGLTLVRSLVTLHGGSVDAASDGPGHGSVFTVRLPLAPAGAGLAMRTPAAPQSLARRRVLVVDDNVDVADSLRLLLDMIGMDVRAVHDGLTALAAMDDFAPDIVLLDIGMPGMDGHEFARHVRARPEGQRVRLVAVSGWGQEEDYQRSREAGVDDHLVKPVDLDALERILAEAPRPAHEPR
ncbi:hybrid sensor histidine kinase/response regulator [Roseateles chitinivorans]|uniref:PAS domain-containing hybrid sensor histidine kinase/response regulator n=1 Tax=Roseateles chitinivorans TaxID=2917965 RepID=UPI003D664D35